MALRLVDFEGVGAAHAAMLAELGITTSETLLREAGTPEARQKLSQATGIPPELLLKWVNHADLTRIKGIGGQYAELLEASGVANVKELGQSTPTRLLTRLAEVNAERKLTRHLPTEAMIATWIEEAKARPVRVVY